MKVSGGGREETIRMEGWEGRDDTNGMAVEKVGVEEMM